MASLPRGLDLILKDRLAEKFPDKLGLKIENVEEMTQGWETDIFFVRFGYLQGSKAAHQDLVVRIYGEGSVSSAQFHKDAYFLHELAKHGIRVPRVELMVSRDNDAQPALVLERIRGESLGAHLKKATTTDRVTLISRMAAEFVRIHRLPWEDFADSAFLNVQLTEQSYVRELIVDIGEASANYGLEEFIPLMDWLEERSPQAFTRPLQLLHNDYHPENILVRDSDQEFVILDWSFSDLGDYRMDLAWTVLLLGVSFGHGERLRFLRSYEDQVGATIDHLEFFEVLKFTQRMLTIATWLDERVENPIKKITKDALRGEYKVHVTNVYARLKHLTGIGLPSIENL
ncbi:MAG: phosphotransferase family protein [Anaerolineales bacterium]